MHSYLHCSLMPTLFVPYPSREDKLDVLERRCVESGLKTSDIWWYADLRRYGSVPHAGTAPDTVIMM
jgi:hypothetical protein